MKLKLTLNLNTLTERVSPDALVHIPEKIPVVANWDHGNTIQNMLGEAVVNQDKAKDSPNLLETDVELFKGSRYQEIVDYIQLAPAGVLDTSVEPPVFKLQSVSIVLKQ